MLTITEDASAHMSQLLADSPEEAVLRFLPAANGLTIQLGQPEPGDTTFTHGEKMVLALDGAVNEALADKTLDLQPTLEDPKLILR